MTPRLEHVSVSLRPWARELPERCIDHGVVWCSPLVGVAVSPVAVVPPRAADAGPPAASDNAVIFPLAFMLGAS